MTADVTGYDHADYLSCPRQCGTDVHDHESSDLIDGRCDTGVPLLDVGGYLACGCHGSQREHTCTAND